MVDRLRAAGRLRGVHCWHFLRSYRPQICGRRVRQANDDINSHEFFGRIATTHQPVSAALLRKLRGFCGFLQEYWGRASVKKWQPGQGQSDARRVRSRRFEPP